MTTWSSAARTSCDAIAEVDTGDGAVLLTDMFGGTPVEPGDLGDGPRQDRGHRRRQPADADQAGQPAPDREASSAPCSARRRPAANTSTSPRSCWPTRADECRPADEPIRAAAQRAGHGAADRRRSATSAACTPAPRPGLSRPPRNSTAEIWVRKNGTEVSGRSIMGLMMLAAAPGAVVELTADRTATPRQRSTTLARADRMQVR